MQVKLLGVYQIGFNLPPLGKGELISNVAVLFPRR